MTRAWWQTRAFVFAAVLVAAIPLIWPAIPPLTDLPGHIGQFRIMLDAGTPALSHHYAFHWALIGNLGVDGLVYLLAPLIGLEPAAKLVVIMIPVLAVAAMISVAREAHGRVPATAAFAFPLAFAMPFQFGFVNFALAAGLAMAGLALWLRLARGSPVWVRILLFVPISWLVWLCHSFGWALLGLFVFGAEWALRVRAGQRWWRAAIGAATMCLPMALPAVLMLSGGDQLAGPTGGWFDWSLKFLWFVSLFRERWLIWDVAGVAVLIAVLVMGVRAKGVSFAPVLGVPALLCAGAFLLLPRFYAGGSYVDMRVLPSGMALGLLALRVDPENGRLARWLASLAAAFYACRIAASTAAFFLLAQGQTAVLRAVPVLPIGSAVLVLVNEPPTSTWDNPRLSHIADVAIARRRVFTNEQWGLAGQQLAMPLHPAAAPFDRDPSQIVYPPGPGYQITDFNQAITGFDRGTFGYVWTIGFPAGRAHAADLVPVWSDGHSAVYRVTGSSQNAAKRAPPGR